MDAERRRINNDVVVAEYRAFCRAAGLPFHFWDELPAGAHDVRVGEHEFRLHEQAMNLFNVLKPEFSLLGSDVIEFRFTDWGGGFSYRAIPIHDFLSEVEDERRRLRGVQRKLDAVAGPVVLLVFLGTFGGGPT